MTAGYRRKAARDGPMAVGVSGVVGHLGTKPVALSVLRNVLWMRRLGFGLRASE